MKKSPLIIDVKVKSCKVRMEVETKASGGIINMEINVRGNQVLVEFSWVRLFLWTISWELGDVIKPVEKLNGESVYSNQRLNISFIVTDTKGPIMLDKDILRLLHLNWNEMFDVNNARKIATTKVKFKEIMSGYDTGFKSELRTLKE